MSGLRQQIKEMIVEVLNLEGMAPDGIADETPLFGEGLGLDSIDALELIVEIEKRFGTKIANRDIAATALASVNSIAAFIAASKGEAPANQAT
ncbi:MAG: acyl carrier protein [Nitrospinae bacterium]|nr:acyl carrier protein [Nitrospinota bacterium]